MAHGERPAEGEEWNENRERGRRRSVHSLSPSLFREHTPRMAPAALQRKRKLEEPCTTCGHYHDVRLKRERERARARAREALNAAVAARPFARSQRLPLFPLSTPAASPAASAATRWPPRPRPASPRPPRPRRPRLPAASPLTSGSVPTPTRPTRPCSSRSVSPASSACARAASCTRTLLATPPWYRPTRTTRRRCGR